MSDYPHLSYNAKLHNSEWFANKTLGSAIEFVRQNAQHYDNLHLSPLLQSREFLAMVDPDTVGYTMAHAVMGLSQNWFKTEFPWNKNNLTEPFVNGWTLLQCMSGREINDDLSDPYSKWILSDFIIQDKELLLMATNNRGLKLINYLVDSHYFLKNSSALQDPEFLNASTSFGTVAKLLTDTNKNWPVKLLDLIKQHKSLRDALPHNDIKVNYSTDLYRSIVDEYEMVGLALKSSSDPQIPLLTLKSLLSYRSNLMIITEAAPKTQVSNKIASLEKKIRALVHKNPRLITDLSQTDHAPMAENTKQFVTLLTNERNFSNVLSNEAGSNNDQTQTDTPTFY